MSPLALHVRGGTLAEHARSLRAIRAAGADQSIIGLDLHIAMVDRLVAAEARTAKVSQLVQGAIELREQADEVAAAAEKMMRRLPLAFAACAAGGLILGFAAGLAA